MTGAAASSDTSYTTPHGTLGCYYHPATRHMPESLHCLKRSRMSTRPGSFDSILPPGMNNRIGHRQGSLVILGNSAQSMTSTVTSSMKPISVDAYQQLLSTIWLSLCSRHLATNLSRHLSREPLGLYFPISFDVFLPGQHAACLLYYVPPSNIHKRSFFSLLPIVSSTIHLRSRYHNTSFREPTVIPSPIPPYIFKTPLPRRSTPKQP